MKRSELKSGQTIELRNGEKCRLIDALGLKCVSENIWASIGVMFNEDLAAVGTRPQTEDIVAVYRPPNNCYLLDPKKHKDLIWARPEHPELPKYYRLMKEGEPITKWCRFQACSAADLWSMVSSSVGETSFDGRDAMICPDIDIPEGYELWHIAGNEAPEGKLPDGARYIYRKTGWQESVLTGHVLSRPDAREQHYCIPITKQEETISIEGKNFSIEELKSILAKHEESRG